jgi:aspartate kinase
MTYYGATVIHPKTIKPLQNACIPLYVKPFSAPTEPGTVIHNIKPAAILPAIIVKSRQSLFSLSTKDHSFITEAHLSSIFKCFSENHIRINLMQNSALTVSVCFDWDERRYKKLIAKLNEDYKVKYNTGLELLTVRHYQKEIILKLVAGKTIYLEQLNRNTAQYVVRGE